MYLRPNCSWRIDKAVLLITPKLALGSAFWPQAVPGLPQLGWLAKLKPSNRNWSEWASVMRKFFSAEKSQLLRPGMMIVLRPAFPNVPNGSSAKAFILNQAFTLGFARLWEMPVAFKRSRLLPTDVFD